MRIAVNLPFLASVLLAVAGPRVTRRMPPRTATLVGQIPLVATAGDWSRTVLNRYDLVSPVTAGVAGVTLVVVCAVIAWTTARNTTAVVDISVGREWWSVCRRCRTAR